MASVAFVEFCLFSPYCTSIYEIHIFDKKVIMNMNTKLFIIWMNIYYIKYTGYIHIISMFSKHLVLYLYKLYCISILYTDDINIWSNIKIKVDWFIARFRSGCRNRTAVTFDISLWNRNTVQSVRVIANKFSMFGFEPSLRLADFQKAAFWLA